MTTAVKQSTSNRARSSKEDGDRVVVLPPETLELIEKYYDHLRFVSQQLEQAIKRSQTLLEKTK